jgi:multidrug transporter EmrE-like cation transporter
MQAYIDWCIKSSSDAKETVECFQEIVPICRFDPECKQKLKDYANKHGLDFDVETGNIEFNTYGYGKLESKNIVEGYLNYLQTDQVLTEGAIINFIGGVASLMGSIISREALDEYLRSLGVSSGYATLTSLGAVIVALLIISISYNAFKNYLTKSARYCSDLSGEEKDRCMRSYIQKGYKTRIMNLQKGMKFCNESKDPMKCKEKVNSKISKLKLKIRG